VSHPIPLHTADRLERTLEALSQRVASSGDEGWVMRILAMLISRCLDHFIEMIEDLLAKIRAGTIVLPDWAYEQSANPAARETEMPRRTATRARSLASRCVRAPRDAHADAEPHASLASQRPDFMRPPPSPRPPLIRREPASLGVRFYPSHAVRMPAENFGRWCAAPRHVHFVTIS
jgi:hypothetical protein